MKKSFIIISLCIFFLACRREDLEAPVPDLTWDLFTSPSARQLAATAFQKAEGVYAVEQGADAFGNLAAAKWSYTAAGADTTFHLSFFCEKEAAYFVCEGRRLDSAILLDGYWRKMVSTETGRVRLTIAKDSGAGYLLRNNASLLGDSLIITGVYGRGNTLPERGIRLRYTKPLFRAMPFQVLAHRGGGRTADLLPASENSVEIIRMASCFGATGVEIDIKLTKDGIPVLFHDATLNERVVQKSGLLGPIENYTFDQLSTLVRLTNGERIPTLRQALEAILLQTPLQFVWLDIKYNGPLQAIRDLQAEYLQKGEAMGRKLEIVIGIPDEDVLNNFKKLSSHQSIPSLVEFSPEETMAVNARIWAPQWTLGLQSEEVAKQQLQGRRVFTWTMDIEENVERYLEEGAFNGILTNYPSVVAYHYYVRQ
jgi:glycerophosphoryl diester phosphodiesterase